MDKPTLVVMAAGMGSRFGGLKQITEVDSFGHILIDFSVHDAILAGFGRVIFIIKKENKEVFDCILSTRRDRWRIPVDVVYQDINDVPPGYSVPACRSRPWGTAHAVSSLYGHLDSPFAVINADDFYGREAFRHIFDFLSHQSGSPSRLAMIGYRLGNTLSRGGGVSRGVCSVDHGYLTDICEVGGIVERDGKIYADFGRGDRLGTDTRVSMNIWGFTPLVISECRKRFARFLDERILTDPLSCEFYLSTVISQLINEGIASVRVIDCDGQWQGITYKEDRAGLCHFLDNMIAEGAYPSSI